MLQKMGLFIKGGFASSIEKKIGICKNESIFEKNMRGILHHLTFQEKSF